MLIHYKYYYIILIANVFWEKGVMIGKVTFSKSYGKSVMVLWQAWFWKCQK